MTKTEFLKIELLDERQAIEFLKTLHLTYNSLFRFGEEVAKLTNPDSTPLYTEEEVPLIERRLGEVFILVDEPFEVYYEITKLRNEK